jgi:hypothetical protein
VCGGSRYGISIRPGFNLADSLRDLTVNGRSYRASAEAALRAWESVDGTPVNVSISNCEPMRAQFTMEVVFAKHRETLHFYRFWVSGDGAVEIVGET